jgi:hypothetical protein
MRKLSYGLIFLLPIGDKSGANAKSIATNCSNDSQTRHSADVTHNFLDNSYVGLLGSKYCNVFLYEDKSNRGLSSAIDFAMAVQRPIAVSDSTMFRHILDVKPSVCITRSNLKTITQNGFASLQKHFNDWSAENLLWDYERILDSVFDKRKNRSKRYIV